MPATDLTAGCLCCVELRFDAVWEDWVCVDDDFADALCQYEMENLLGPLAPDNPQDGDILEVRLYTKPRRISFCVERIPDGLDVWGGKHWAFVNGERVSYSGNNVYVDGEEVYLYRWAIRLLNEVAPKYDRVYGVLKHRPCPDIYEWEEIREENK